MPQSECVDCDKPAAAYWGRYAYCKRCLILAQLEDPKAHLCVTCDKQQPTNVSWHRNAPCKECQ